MNNRAVIGNANATRLPLADGSVHMVATSPPYWGLRDYGVAGQLGAEPLHDCLAWARGDEPCGGCYVCNMRAVFAEVWRVLREDGTLFLNLGDSYAAGKTGRDDADRGTRHTDGRDPSKQNEWKTPPGKQRPAPPGLKAKDLTGIPWRVALALQADGWFLRSDIIWAKPNPMPESVTDRPTKAHEYVFLLTKAARYYWDAEAVKERSAWQPGSVPDAPRGSFSGKNGDAAFRAIRSERNRRTVWTVATQPYSGAHFATWPPALVEPMVKAGSSERGVCSVCGKPWERVVDRTAMEIRHSTRPDAMGEFGRTASSGTMTKPPSAVTRGWRPTCDHDAPTVPAVVLDPFAGSGTTVMVARQLGRIGVGFDLSETYLRECAAVRLDMHRVNQWGNGKVDATDYADTLPLFASAGEWGQA